MESNQEVPDFLADKKPEEGEELNFDDDSEEEDDEGEGATNGDTAGAWGGGDGGNAWGGDADATPAAAAVTPAVSAPADDWNANAATAW